MTVELVEKDHAAVRTAARFLCKRYRGYVEFEDVCQELYLILVAKYRTVRRYRKQWSEKKAHHAVVKLLRREGEAFCIAEKKRILVDWEPSDAYYYSIPQLAKLLWVFFDPHWMEPPAVVFDKEPSNSGDPADSSNLMTMIADVSWAFDRMPVKDQELLRRVYGSGNTPAEVLEQLAREWGCSKGAADMRVRRVIGRLRALLGGPKPKNA